MLTNSLNGYLQSTCTINRAFGIYKTLKGFSLSLGNWEVSERMLYKTSLILIYHGGANRFVWKGSVKTNGKKGATK